MTKRIIIMAGGTGGHIFPALAVADYLIKKGWEVTWLGTKKGMESRIVPENNIKIEYLSVQGFRGKSLVVTAKNIRLLILSFFQVFSIFRKYKPNVVIGFGGYVAAPGGFIARIMKIPLVIHEQNQVVGTTNRLLVKIADKALQAFPQSFPADSQAILTGNPLRHDFLSVVDDDLWIASSKQNFRILVIGGSQGARALNEIIPQSIDATVGISVMHQTGHDDFQSVKDSYQKSKIDAQISPFIHNMIEAYRWADMIICRSGAMTVSEVSAMGLPALFIPLPYAIDDHQTANARYLAEAGAAIILPQAEMNKASLVKAIDTIKNSLMTMGVAMREKARLNATEQVATYCIQVAKND